MKYYLEAHIWFDNAVKRDERDGSNLPNEFVKQLGKILHDEIWYVILN